MSAKRMGQRDEKQEKHPEHEGTPDEPDGALHVVRFRALAHTHFRTVLHTAVLMQCLTQPDAQSTAAACEQR